MPTKHPTQNQRGRPRVPAASRRRNMITAKLTDAEARALKQAAHQAGMTISDFLVWRAIGARGRPEVDG